MSNSSNKLQVLILCTANPARSQMGEGLLRHLAGGKVDVYSAGRAPSSVNPHAVRAMRERGCDISGQRSDHIDSYIKGEFDFVTTIGDSAAESCPVFPGRAQRIHWRFPDPAAVVGDDAAVAQAFSAVRAGLAAKMREWLKCYTRLKDDDWTHGDDAIGGPR